MANTGMRESGSSTLVPTYAGFTESKKDSWDDFYLHLAESYSQASKDPSTKVGAIIVDSDNRLVSTGFNGLPRGIEDTEERLQNREIKYKLILHAELNAILFSRRDLKGCSIYTYPFMPCSSCALIIIQSGITRVIAPKGDNPRWEESFKTTQQLFKEANVELLLFNRELTQPEYSEYREILKKRMCVAGSL